MPEAPNLFIVGAPKSGTTALSSYLCDHPDIWVAPHELHYFGSDLGILNRRGELRSLPYESYLGGFRKHVEKRYRGDHSVFYLYSTRAASEIHEFDSASRVIIMLRNPVDQMHSQHSEMFFQGDEDIRDFGEALAAEEERKRGLRIPDGCQKAFGLYYRDLAAYEPQVARYLSVFGPEQVFVIIHDDFVADPAGVYRQVLEFLDVNPDHRPSFEVVNPNKAVRSLVARDLLRRGPAGVRRVARWAVPGEQARATIRRRVAAMNTVQRPRPPMDTELRIRLEEDFDPEVRRLAKLLDRDLDGWTTGSASR